MHFILPTITLAVASACNVSGLRRFWEILPRDRMWPRIAHSLETDAEVTDYIQNYARPFVDWQKAARNDKMTVDNLRQDAKAMVDVLLETVRSFNITQTDFEGRQSKVYKASIEGAIKVIQGPKADALKPIFRPAALRVFMFQRLDDMLLTSDDWEAFQRQRKRFVGAVKGMGRRLERLKEEDLRGLVPVTWDLAEMERRIKTFLTQLRSTPKSNGKGRRRLIAGIRKLGSTSDTAKIVVPILTLLLATIGSNLIL